MCLPTDPDEIQALLAAPPPPRPAVGLTNYSHDVPRLLDRIKEFEQQRDAALKLADKWTSRADKELGGEVHGEREIRIDEDACCADELRAIFEPKGGR